MIAGAYLNFDYKLVDNLDFTKISLIYSFTLLGFILIMGVALILLTKLCVNMAIASHSKEWAQRATKVSFYDSEEYNKK